MEKKKISRFRDVGGFGNLLDLDIWLKLQLIELYKPDKLYNWLSDPKLNNYNCSISLNPDDLWTNWVDYGFLLCLTQNPLFWKIFFKMEKWQQKILDKHFSNYSAWEINKKNYLRVKLKSQ